MSRNAQRDRIMAIRRTLRQREEQRRARRYLVSMGRRSFGRHCLWSGEVRHYDNLSARDVVDIVNTMRKS